MAAITVEQLSKVYRVAQKEPGLRGTIDHFLHRKYRNIDAVKNVSFTVEPGEIVGFLGPNGAGKTTTLKMLTGLIHPSGGKIDVLGHWPFSREKAFLRDITLVMGQKQQLIWDLPCVDSLRINAAVYEISDADFKSRIDELSTMLQLGPELTQPVRKLSLGQRMKAELMASLLHRPRVLFLDEPTIGLDVNAQDAVRNFLRTYNQKYGATILLTSHYMADITALCKRVLLIHQGTLMYDGSLSGILDRFAPYREVKIETTTVPDRAMLAELGEVEAIEGRVSRLLVRREHMTQTVQRMLSMMDVVDLTVTDPPIEGIIGKLFTQGSVATSDAAAPVSVSVSGDSA